MGGVEFSAVVCRPYRPELVGYNQPLQGFAWPRNRVVGRCLNDAGRLCLGGPLGFI